MRSRHHVLLSTLCAVAGSAPNAIGQDEAPAATWHGSMRGWFQRHCATCHRPGMTAPFALEAYGDVRRRRAQILRMVEARTMPPWLPDTRGATPLADDRHLADADLRLLRRWIEAGAPEGTAPDPRAGEPDPAAGPDRAEAADLVLGIGTAIAVPAAGPDLFRNLVVPVDIDEPRWVRRVDWRLRSPAVHHAVLQLDRSGQCRALDARSPEPGFDGMDLAASAPPGGYFVGWTPGKQARPFGDGLAFLLRPGDDLVVQLHLTPTGRAETVDVALGLHFASEPPTRTPAHLMLSREDIAIAAGAPSHVVRDELELPVPVTLHGIYPHAHYLATSFEVTATRSGQTRVLLRIPRWDFNWQDDYRFAAPVRLEAGTTMAMEVRYDNSAANPFQTSDPPRDVRFGFASRDEMATASLTVFLDDEAHRPALDEARWRHEVAQKPDDWFCRAALGRVLLATGRPAEALDHLDRALALEPRAVDAWSLVAAALAALDQPAGAIRALEKALAIQPDNPKARLDLASLRAAAGDLDGAERELRTAIARGDGGWQARFRLGQLLASRGEFAASIGQLEAAIAERPDQPVLWNNLASARFDAGQEAAALSAARRALELDERYVVAWLNLTRIHLAREEPAEAREALDRATALAPDHPGVAELRRALR